LAQVYITEGEAVLVRVAFTYPDKTPMPATDVVIRARKPDGTVVEGAVTPGQGVGVFEARFVAEIGTSGPWRVMAECAGPEPAIDEDKFAVNRRRFTEP
jgi:hypothetical protein